MKRKDEMVVAGHLRAEDLERKMKEAESIEQYRRWQVIFLRQSNPSMPVGKVAKLCAVAYRTVTQWTWLYNNNKPEDYVLSGRGGRRYGHLSEDAEIKLLQNLKEKAGKGHLITVLAVKKTAEKEVGHELPKDYAYDLLHRHKWRKIMPHTHHPKKDGQAQEAFKKTSRIFWLPPESDCPVRSPKG